jgi:hypothetical protein
MSVATFHVRVNKRYWDDFKKVLRQFEDDEVYDWWQTYNEFTVIFAEPTTTVFDARDFFPMASWTQDRNVVSYSS